VIVVEGVADAAGDGDGDGEMTGSAPTTLAQINITNAQYILIRVIKTD
jgi:hypothetical protein